MFFLIYLLFLLPLLYSCGCAFCFSPFFFFFALLLSRLWEGRDQGADITTQSGSHVIQLNGLNLGQNIGGDIGVFSGGCDRLIGQNLSFLGSTSPTQGGNYVAITVATTALQYAASAGVSSVP